MGTVYRETFTKPLPIGAELFARKGERFARWTDGKGRKRTARVTTPVDGTNAGADRLLIEAVTYTAKFRNGAGHVVKVSTGCRSLDAAKAVLSELETRADKVRAGTWSAAEDSTLDHQRTSIAAHVTAYVAHLRTKPGKGGKRHVAPLHVANVEHYLGCIIAACGFKRLRDLNRKAVERWASERGTAGAGARTINAGLAALTAFGNWCVSTDRMLANPFARFPRRDESANPRRQRRALDQSELRRLLYVARYRPLAEYGRLSVKLADASQRENKRSRRTWEKAPLTADVFDAALGRGREALAGRPEFVAELEHRGRERALIYKALVMTGLRKGELESLTVGQLELDGPVAYAVLRAADEKAGRGADVPLRADLVADLRAWLDDRLDAARDAANAKGSPIPARLSSDTGLFAVSGDLIRAFDLDLLAAGLASRVKGMDRKGRPCWKIAKRDERGRTLDLHCLRHTFATHLSKGGIAPRTAQAALRHSTIELTMRGYTDPKLLDVSGALDVLPSLPLPETPKPQRAKATGTGGPGALLQGPDSLVPTLVPTPGFSSTPGAIADKSGGSRAFAKIGASGSRDDSRDAVTSADKKRATRLERATTSLEG